MRHLILRSAFLGVVHFDQEVVSFNVKQRWNMVKVSCAMSDSHSSHIRYCWNRMLSIDIATVLQTSSNACHLTCKPGRFRQWSGNLSMIQTIRSGKMTGPFEAFFSPRPAWPFWSLSLHYNVCSAWCWKIAEGLMFQMFWHLTQTDLSGSCCHFMLPLATATFVAMYGVLYVFSSKPLQHPGVWEASDFASRGQVLESSECGFCPTALHL